MRNNKARFTIHQPASFRRLDCGNRGAMLIVVIFALFLITALTTGVLVITTNAMHLNNLQQLRAKALNIAESGAEYGTLYLKSQAYPPSGTTSFNITAPPVSTGEVPIVTISPDSNNPNVFLKTYKITSIGTTGTVSGKVEIVVKQATFGKYAYFTDREKSTSGSNIWWNSKDLIDGPMHSNNSGGSNFNIDYSGWSSNTPTRPIFMDNITASGTSINYSPSTPTTEDTFRKVYLNGSKGYKLGVTKIVLPPSTSAQKEAAWGATSGFPATTSGVYLRAGSNGGVFIQGDSTVTMSVDGSGNQVLTVTQVVSSTVKTTVVTYNKATGTTTASGTGLGTGSPTSAASLSNGLIYCTGNITALSGTIADNTVANGAITQRNAFTIATDTNASKDITITGDIVYQHKPDKTLASTAYENLRAGTLGLVGQDIIIAADTSGNHPNREIDAVMIAGSSTVDGSIKVNSYDSGGTGTLKVLGGLIQSARGPVGTISGGIVNHGYAKDYKYDPRLATDPPPFYPTTGQYDRMSWMVKPVN
ncbi:MAG: hypothetical protein NT018_11110 [Armatimonadetes bacterium]|nr:hypothetical protein [Armatimonadota bacterium]